MGPDSSERALFRDWRGALLREEVANRRDALRRRQHGRTEAAKLVRVAEAKLLVLCTHRVDARDIATPLADVIVVLRTVSSPATGERGMPRSATVSRSDG